MNGLPPSTKKELNMKKKILFMGLALMLSLSSILVACDVNVSEDVNVQAPSAPAAFSRLRINNTFFDSRNTGATAYVRHSLPREAGSLVTDVGSSATQYLVSGSTSYPASSTSVTVTHGLGAIPTRVIHSVEGAVPGIAASSVGYNAIVSDNWTATTFDLDTFVATNQTVTVYWIAFR